MKSSFGVFPYLVHVLVHVLCGVDVRGLGADDEESVALQAARKLARDVHALGVGVNVPGERKRVLLRTGYSV